MFERLFKITENNTSVRRETIAGITTFITMVYIVFVNPAACRSGNGSSIVATRIAAAIGCFIMGLWANYH